MDRFAPAALLPELEPQKPVHFFLHTPLQAYSNKHTG